MGTSWVDNAMIVSRSHLSSHGEVSSSFIVALLPTHLEFFFCEDFAWSRFWGQVFALFRDTYSAVRTVRKENNVEVLYHT